MGLFHSHLRSQISQLMKDGNLSVKVKCEVMGQMHLNQETFMSVRCFMCIEANDFMG